MSIELVTKKRSVSSTERQHWKIVSVINDNEMYLSQELQLLQAMIHVSALFVTRDSIWAGVNERHQETGKEIVNDKYISTLEQKHDVASAETWRVWVANEDGEQEIIPQVC